MTSPTHLLPNHALLLLSKGTAASKRSEEVVRTPVLKKLAADQEELIWM